MSKHDQLFRAMNLLSQAMLAAGQSMPNDKHVVEAKVHMKQAMQKLENANKRHATKKSNNATDASKWWGDVVAHAPMAKMSEQAAIKTLAHLDAMILTERKKLDELENTVKQKTAKKSVDEVGGYDLLNG